MENSGVKEAAAALSCQRKTDEPVCMNTGLSRPIACSMRCKMNTQNETPHLRSISQETACRVSSINCSHVVKEDVRFCTCTVRNYRFRWSLGLRYRACGRSLSGVAGSNPAGGIDVCLLWVLCVAMYLLIVGVEGYSCLDHTQLRPRAYTHI